MRLQVQHQSSSSPSSLCLLEHWRHPADRYPCQQDDLNIVFQITQTYSRQRKGKLQNEPLLQLAQTACGCADSTAEA